VTDEETSANFGQSYLNAQTPHTPNCSSVIAFEMGSTEFTADTLIIMIDLMIGRDRPTKRKSNAATKNVKQARWTVCSCSSLRSF
jgi:hypothetical protein